jgi:hypothetical protein
MAKKEMRILGRVINHDTKQGIADLRIEAWDKDLLFDDMLGSDISDAQGAFTIDFNKRYFSEIVDRQPDIYFKVFRKKRLLTDTCNKVLWNINEPDLHVVIPLSLDELPNTNGKKVFRVEGWVTTEDGLAVREVIVQAWDQGLGSERLLASGSTDRGGRYLLFYDPADLDGKTRADLMLRVLDLRRKRVELARSEVFYQAEPVLVVDLKVVAAEVARASEYERLLTAVEPLLGKTKLVDLDADSVLYVANRSGWDARMVAIAAESVRRLVLPCESALLREHSRYLGNPRPYGFSQSGLPSPSGQLLYRR